MSAVRIMVTSYKESMPTLAGDLSRVDPLMEVSWGNVFVTFRDPPATIQRSRPFISDLLEQHHIGSTVLDSIVANSQAAC
jgi:hypothetical protein